MDPAIPPLDIDRVRALRRRDLGRAGARGAGRMDGIPAAVAAGPARALGAVPVRIALRHAAHAARAVGGTRAAATPTRYRAPPCAQRSPR